MEAADAKIVISSSWRHIWDFHEIAEMFASRGFRSSDRIIGQTPSGQGFRGKEIDDWLGTDEERARIDDSEAGIIQYVILDDDTDFTTEQTKQHFVHTDAKVGLTDEDVRRALAILQRV
jgi:hypothetical protein